MKKSVKIVLKDSSILLDYSKLNKDALVDSSLEYALNETLSHD